MSKVFVVVSNGDDGADQIEKIFANSADAEKFADTLCYPGSDIAVVEMEVE